MKAGQRTDEQIGATLQRAQSDDITIAALCKENGISQNTFYAWRKKFAGYPRCG